MGAMVVGTRIEARLFERLYIDLNRFGKRYRGGSERIASADRTSSR